MLQIQLEFYGIMTEISYGLMQKEKQYEEELKHSTYSYFQNEILTKSIQRLELFMLINGITDEKGFPIAPKNETDAIINYFRFAPEDWPTNAHVKFRELITEAWEDEVLVNVSLDLKKFFTTQNCYSLAAECLRYNEDAMQKRLFYTLYNLNDEQYTYCRKLIIKNRILDFLKRNEFKQTLQQLQIPEQIIETIFDQAYETIPRQAIGICSYCGWTVMEMPSGKKYCSQKVCKIKTENFTKIAQLNKTNQVRLNTGVMKFFAIPGEYEIHLAEFCESLGFQYMLWPHKDVYDLQIVTPQNNIYAVDLKAYSNPYGLYKHLNENKPFNKIEGNEKCYILIPDEVMEKKGYLEIVQKALNLTTIRCMSLKQFKQQLRKEVHTNEFPQTLV